MEDVSAIVAKLYEGHPYPPPIRDLAEAIAQGNYQVGDPTLWAPMLWPDGRPRDKLKILVAGCGTQQAAWFAHTNRACDVIGVDLSEPSLAHHRYLQEKHGLVNLRLFKGDLRDVAAIGETFDVIVCTGVLHHMKHPDEGMRALANVLADDGVALRQPVKLGLRGVGLIEIVEGLAEGAQAILPLAPVIEGDKVRGKPPREKAAAGIKSVPAGMTGR